MASYKTLGGNIKKVEGALAEFKALKTKWSSTVKSSETFVEQYNNQIDDIITELENYIDKLYEAGADLDRWAEWADVDR